MQSVLLAALLALPSFLSIPLPPVSAGDAARDAPGLALAEVGQWNGDATAGWKRTSLQASLEEVSSLLAQRAQDAADVPALAGLVAQEQANLETAKSILEVLGDPESDDLQKAVAIAKRGTSWQADALGLKLPPVAPILPDALPSQAALELASRYSLAATSDFRPALDRLDALPEPARGALARFLAAFLAYDGAGRATFAKADLAALGPLEAELAARPGEIPSPSLQQVLATAGIDFAPILAARNLLLEATVGLDQALQRSDLSALAPCTGAALAPAFSIDLSSCPNTYTQDFALLLDAGGNDVYFNNAGGSSLIGGICPVPSAPEAAAALVDLGAGNDQFGNPAARRACGANGGGRLGSGFLLDAGGTNQFYAYSDGVNGGGEEGGIGFLLEAGSGNDRYDAASVPAWGFGDGANGGGGFGGVGFLLDMGGSDLYTTSSTSATNGAGFTGAGFLVDGGGGNDRYENRDCAGCIINAGKNGGGVTGGRGFLLDEGGSDVYWNDSNSRRGLNGGGQSGIGFLLDAAGRDAYTATEHGTNGGGSLAGAGTLIDLDGYDDAYTATRLGVNGGASGGTSCTVACVPAPVSFGLLYDGGGRDVYQDLDGGTGVDRNLVFKGILGAQFDSGGSESFESGAPGWTFTGFWHVTTRRSFNPGHSLWYGQEATGNYANGAANSGTATSHTMRVPVEAPTLGFFSWYSTELGTAWDRKLVEISKDGGATWALLGQVSDSPSQWNYKSFSLAAYAGQLVKVRFRFDTVDSSYNAYEGWYVDSIQVAGCLDAPCLA